MSKNELGDWKVVRKSDQKLEVELPPGLKITADEFSIEDLLEAIQKHKVLSTGEPTSSGEGIITVRCCSGNTAIA